MKVAPGGDVRSDRSGHKQVRAVEAPAGEAPWTVAAVNARPVDRVVPARAAAASDRHGASRRKEHG